jgi:hypothetical protein
MYVVKVFLVGITSFSFLGDWVIVTLYYTGTVIHFPEAWFVLVILFYGYIILSTKVKAFFISREIFELLGK